MKDPTCQTEKSGSLWRIGTAIPFSALLLVHLLALVMGSTMKKNLRSLSRPPFATIVTAHRHPDLLPTSNRPPACLTTIHGLTSIALGIQQHRYSTRLKEFGRRLQKKFLDVSVALIFAIALLIQQAASAAILTVTDFGDSGAPGQLRTLINLAAPGDTINIPAGTIQLSGTANEDANMGGDLDIQKNLTINGAGPEVTIIDGGMLDRVLDILGSSTTVAVLNLTIRNGKVPAGQSGAGGIQNAGSLTLTNLVVNNNVGPTGCLGFCFTGGGIFNSGALVVNKSVISSNFIANNDGGGIYNNMGTVVVLDSTVSDNSASSGGGIRNFGGMVKVTNSAILNNKADNTGGGIDNDEGRLIVINSTFSGNSAGFRGGAILNSAFSGGVTINNSTVSDNIATNSPRGGAGGGGGIYNSVGGIAITNTTFSGNQAPNGGDGGGIHNDSGSVTLANVTLSANTAARLGGNITNFSGGMILRNTIVANAFVINCAGMITSADNNLASDTSCGLNGPGDIQNTNPLLGPLQDNGGPTQTHALLAGSPAIDAGNAAGCVDSSGTLILTDQRGFFRNSDGDSDGIIRCDIGAYEFQSAPAQPSVSINDESISEGDSGTADAVFTVSLSFPGISTVTVTFSTADGTAIAGSDYVATSGNLTFNPGEVTKTITVQVNGDTVDEPDETFFVNLNSASNATIADDVGVGTILNDDGPKIISLDCSTGSVQEALSHASPGSTISVSGTCNENILVRNDRVRVFLDGGGTAMIVGSNPDSPALDIRGKAISIQGFIITGGSSGIEIQRGANAVIDSNVIEGVGGHGVVVNQLAFGVLTNNTIQNNARDGVVVKEGSAARIGFNTGKEVSPIGNTIQGNDGNGITVSGSSSARVVGNDISNNGGNGVEVMSAAQADIANNAINGNNGDGIHVSENSTVQLGEDPGLFALPNSGTGNAGFGISCDFGGALDGLLGTLTGNTGATNIDASCPNSLSP